MVHIEINTPKGFNLSQTLNCGQCFRFKEKDDGTIYGVIYDKYVELKLKGNILFVDSSSEISKNELNSYFDFDIDYGKINKSLSKDETLSKAIEYSGGIRILKQTHWEALCSFILSQNNNIKRISGIIERLCENFGSPIQKGFYTFPKAEDLSSLTVDDLAPLRSGFRAKYVLDAAKKVCSGEVGFSEIENSDIDTAREILMRINGVGPKVADCTLLFGFHKLDAFPKDVWIKKVLQKYYPNGFPEYAKAYGGIAQQYLFHYIRTAESSNKD